MSNLSHLDGKAIAIVLILANRSHTLRGVATYEADEEFGSRLRIRFDSLNDRDGHPQLIIDENDWAGTVVETPSEDCDYVITLDLRPNPESSSG